MSLQAGSTAGATKVKLWIDNLSMLELLQLATCTGLWRLCELQAS